MNEYYVDLNAPEQGPVILAQSASEVAGGHNLQRDGCRTRLIQAAPAPLEDLLLSLTEEESLRLRYKTKEALDPQSIPPAWLNEMAGALKEKINWLLDEISEQGISDVTSLRATLARYKKRVDYLDQDNEVMLALDIYAEDQEPLAQLRQKLAAQAPAREIIEDINKNKLARYFAPELKNLPTNFSPAKIAQTVTEAVPAAIAFGRFYGEFLKEFNERYHAATAKLTDPVFQAPETYKQFPGIKAGRCWAATDNLPQIEGGQDFNYAGLVRSLEDRPQGYLLRATNHHAALVVLPSRANIKIEARTELNRSQPLANDLEGLFAGRTSADNARALMGWFDEFIQPELERVLPQPARAAQTRACELIIFGQESLGQLYTQRPHYYLNDKAVNDKLNFIHHYLNQQQLKVSAQLYDEIATPHHAARRRQNISKGLALTAELRDEFLAAQADPTKKFLAAHDIIFDLTTVLVTGDEIQRQQKKSSRARPDGGKFR